VARAGPDVAREETKTGDPPLKWQITYWHDGCDAAERAGIHESLSVEVTPLTRSSRYAEREVQSTYRTLGSGRTFERLCQVTA
jgi:hypothetical protein